MSLAPVRWMEDGWFNGLRQLWHASAEWRGQWVLLQYTALAWSRRGFSFGALAVLAMLRRGGARVAVVFHEPDRQRGSGMLQGIRGACQDWVIRRLYKGATKAIFADPLETILWLPKNDVKAAFIPIGANVPEPTSRSEASRAQNGRPQTVTVFCLTQPPKLERELADISYAIRSATTNGLKLHVVFLGRGTAEAKKEIERAFVDIPVEVSNLGLLSAEKVSQTLAQSDAMLCVRDRLFPRRGSAIAGIACGVPIIGYAGRAERTPLEEAGIVLVPYGDVDALGVALLRVLDDPNLSRDLQEKSSLAQRRYFSWDSIATAFVSVLDLESDSR